MRPALPAIVLMLVGASICGAQGLPTEPCPFPYNGWATPPGQKLLIAEVAASHATELLMPTRKPIALPADAGTPVLIYRKSGNWTCGYFSGRHGSGPGWIRSEDLRVVKYSPRPDQEAWAGIWVGGEDRISIHAGKEAGTLHAEGNAQWHGGGDVVHLGHMEGTATPNGNRLHFVAGACTVDMTLLGRYIVASDNMGCGGANVRFEGIWKHVKP